MNLHKFVELKLIIGIFSVKLKHFEKFADITEALVATTAAVEGKISKSLKKVLKNHIAKDAQEQLLVADAKLGNFIYFYP